MASAAVVGAGVGRLRTRRAGGRVAAFAAVTLQVSPFDRTAPMVTRGAARSRERRGPPAVTACLRRDYDGTTIMASMGALAHYMQELSADGFGIADFLHEGSGPLWQAAVARGPAPLAGWVLVEEVAEGATCSSSRQKAMPHFLDGYDRVCEGGNVALYRRRK